MGRDKDGIYRCERGAHGVGKILGKNKWVHVSALDAIPQKDQDLIEKARSVLRQEKGIEVNFDADVMVRLTHAERDGAVTFCYSPDWKVATEPECGPMYGVKGLNTGNHSFWEIQPPMVPYIYHHKWMFVKDDYTGFDMAEAKEWSEVWENHDVVRALMADKSENFRLRIGKKDYWQKKVTTPIVTSIKKPQMQPRQVCVAAMEKNPTYERIVNDTYINRGKMAWINVIPRFLPLFAEPGDEILDFGAGRGGLHMNILRKRGLTVTGYECGENFCEGLHDSHALERQYDIVYASNVLNVQPTVKYLQEVLDLIESCVLPGGVFFCNFPDTPRKCPGLTNTDVTDLLNERYERVIIIDGPTLMWKCIKAKDK